MTSAWTKFDQGLDAVVTDLKYYHDGQNVIAEYDKTTDVLMRRYGHGALRVDERAVLYEGSGSTVDTYY